MKSYTDIEQSKVLSEILPHESADMFYRVSNKTHPTFRLHYYGHVMSNKDVCAWSLAALLGIFPPYLFEFERGIDFNVYPHLNGKGWHCSYMPNCIENMKKDKFRLITHGTNLVDACYDMIIKLHELNLL